MKGGREESGLGGGLDKALAKHDARLRERGLRVWLGAEPTFTDPRSTEPEWIGAAEGPTKAARAKRLWRRLARPGALALRTIGRQYPDEEAPRWSFGLWERRHGGPVWSGPPDPALRPEGAPPLRAPAPARLRDVLAAALEAQAFETDDALPHRLVTGEVALDDPRLGRPPLEGRPVPPAGLRDPLAEEGCRLVTFGEEEGATVLELPRFEDVDLFLAFLEVVAGAAHEAGVDALVLRGHGPPVNERVRWQTITPDPGVIEVNMAPAKGVASFHADTARIHAAAEAEGLAPTRRHYNGALTDSGGGGHLTFGGPSPDASPFFLEPRLLPRLLAYLNQHPSRSYFFGAPAMGGSGQAPRPDEGARELFLELELALERLERAEAPSPELLWGTLAPFLCDRFGNTHRSEVNVEKLWNPWLPGRGKLGVIELRALRQAPTALHATARAVLFRSVLARLVKLPFPLELKDWGHELHDRFALPFFLRADLEAVLRDVEQAGFPVERGLKAELVADPHRVVGEVDLGAPGEAPLTLTVKQAVEFWPLVGDLTKQGGTTRLVDSSAKRLELLLRGEGGRVGRARVGVRFGDAPGGGPRIFGLPMVQVDDGEREAVVFGVRYRTFVPNPGLHPDLPAHDPLELVVEQGGLAWRVALHGWKPGGGVYPGIPEDDAEAAARRIERFVVTPLEAPPTQAPAPRSALTRYTFDLRRLA